MAAEIERLRTDNANRRALLLVQSAERLGPALAFPKHRPGDRTDRLPGCGCETYSDVLTLRRWNALGYRVNRGEHAVHRVQMGRGGIGIALFCRCQVTSLWPDAPANPWDGVDAQDLPFD